MAKIGDGISVEVGVDTSKLEKGEKEIADSARRTEGILQKMADVVKAAFSATVAAVVSSGLRQWLQGTERSAMSLASAMKQSAIDTAKSLQQIGQASAAAMTAVGPAMSRLALSLASTRTLLLAGLVSAAVIAGVTGLSNTVKAAIRDIDQMGVASSRLGIPVENFTKLAFAARAAGVSTDDFKSSMDTLTKNLAKDDATSPMIRALQAMGLESNSATQSTMSLDQVIARVADKFKGFEDGANKTALAVAIFGERGAELIPLLNQGSGSVDALKQKASELGSTLSEKVAADAQVFTQNMARAHAINSGISSQIGAAFLPAMNWLASAFVKSSEAMQLANVAGVATRGMLGALYVAARPVVAIFESVSTAIGRLVSAAMQLAQGNMKEALDTLTSTPGAIGDVWKSAATDIIDTASYVTTGVSSANHALVGLRGSTEAWAASVKKAAPELRSVAEIQAAQAKAAADAANKLTELVRDREMPITQKLAELKTMVDNGTISWQQYHSAVRAAHDLSKQLSEEITRQNEAFASMTAADLLSNDQLPMAKKIEQLNELVRSGALGWREYLSAMGQVKTQGEAAMNDLASTTSQALTSIFDQSKTAAIAAALINTYQAITKALASYPPPYSYAMAGLQAAMGFAQVAKIRSTNKNGGGGGASFSASSASASRPTASSSPTNDQTMYVRGFDPKQMFTGDMVRDIAKKMVAYQKDGGRVIIQ